MKRIPLTKGKFAIVDDCDFKMVVEFKWYAASNGRYAGRTIYRAGNYTLLMHRFLIGPIGKLEIDHINGNGLDNRRCNLRVCSHSQNQQNMKKHRDIKSGLKGAYQDRTNKRWRSIITCNGKRIHLGYFKTKQEAAKAYDKASIKFHKEFGRQNKTL